MMNEWRLKKEGYKENEEIIFMHQVWKSKVDNNMEKPGIDKSWICLHITLQFLNYPKL
jgi:hypothetical protein